MNKKLLLFIIFICVFFISGKAQTNTAFAPTYDKNINYIVITNMDTKHFGYVIEETKNSITLLNKKTNYKLFLYKSEIKSIEPATSTTKKNNIIELEDENENADYYMFASSTLLFESGKIKANYHWGLIENITFSISENWAITANTIFFLPFSVGVKCAYKVGKNNYIGGNFFGMGNLNSRNPDQSFVGYGAKASITKGSSNNNFTVAGGILGLNSSLFKLNTTQPFLNLYYGNFAYCNRFSNKFSLNTEVWYFPESQSGFAGLGFKRVSNKFSSWTLGCYTVLNNFNNSFSINIKTIPIPYIGYSQSF